jgi:uncharacterized membrane protein
MVATQERSLGDVSKKILVSVFDSERMAFEGLTALKELHRDGDITVYGSSVIAKDASGTVSVRQEADSGPIGTLVGIVTGGLVGLLGGPAGVAVGAYLGGFGGVMYDLFKAGVSIDFVDEVSAALTPGKAAVIADIEETWVTPIDTRLGALGGITFRRLPGEVIDAELVRETDAARMEVDQLREEIRTTSGEAQANVEKAMDSQRRKLEAMVDRLDQAIDKEKAEFETRLATLREQQAKARDHQRQQIDARMDELKASHQARKAKLEEAREHAKESLEGTREALVS